MIVLVVLITLLLLIGFSSCSSSSADEIKQVEMEKLVIISSPILEHVRGDLYNRYKVRRIKTSTVNYIVLPSTQNYTINDTILYRYQ